MDSQLGNEIFLLAASLLVASLKTFPKFIIVFTVSTIMPGNDTNQIRIMVQFSSRFTTVTKQTRVGFCPSKTGCGRDVDKTWLKLVKTGQNWTKLNISIKAGIFV